MVRKIIYSVATVLVAASLIWAANDPWKSKPYDQWDDKDIHRIFNDSPWSKVVQIGSSSPAASAMPADTSAASPGQQSRGMGGGGQYGQPAVPPQTPQPSSTGETPFVVRWVSSRTIREAAVRNAILKGQLKPEDASKDLAQPVDMYQVLVAGPNMKAFQSADEDAIKKSAVLELKRTKEKLAPSDVKIEHKADGSIESIVFLFPKKAANGESAIPANEKGAEFSTSLSGAKINASFDFSKMEDSQGRDL
ncbi:MAG: hypothetical protein WCC03_16160 [Candidatus Acidiferrales bacterium]